MASTVTIVASSADTVDLQNPATNPDAAPVTTPRQGGFTLRNRFDAAKLSTPNKSLFKAGLASAAGDWSSVASGSDASLAAAYIHVLHVPRRTLVKDMTLFAVKGKAGPNLQVSFGGSAGSSVALTHDLNEVNGNLYANAYKSYSQSSLASSMVELCQMDTEDPDDGTSDTHGWFDGALLGQSASWSSLSVPTAAAMHLQYDLATSANTIDAGAWTQPAYFPHGGFITLRTDASISADSVNSSVASFSQELVGVWEIQADCQYVPE